MTTTNPLISIIMPVYNVQKFITECLDSVVNQTLKDIEIICIDDCSTDNSANIIKDYALNDNRIKYFCLNQNSGSGPARNYGIKMAQGEFTSFMDPDDLYGTNTSLEKLYTAAKEHDVIACGGNILAFQNDNVEASLPNIWTEIRFQTSGMHSYKDYHYPAGYYRFIYQTSFIKKNKIKFPAYRRRQDPVFFVKAMSLIKDYYVVNETVYLYRINHKEINWDEEKLYGVLCSFEDSFKIYIKNKLMDHHARDYLDLIQFLKMASVLNTDKLTRKANKILKNIPFDDFLTSRYNTTRKYKNIKQALPRRLNKGQIARINNKIEDYKFIHIMHNDKFNAPLIKFFNKYFDSTQHAFVFHKFLSEKEFPLPKSKNIFQLDEITDLKLHTDLIDKVIIHGLFYPSVTDWLHDNPQILKKSYWVIWGGDLYCGEESKKAMHVKKNFKGYLPVLADDFEIAQKKYDFNGKFHPITYIAPTTLEYLSAAKAQKRKKDYTSIQINNSADDSIVEILKKLEKFKDKPIKIYVVLSYGKIQHNEEIINIGQSIFGEKFCALTEFLNAEDYSKHLANLDILIMNQQRQQGLGNVYALAHLGSKIFLRSDITTYNSLIKKKIHIYDTLTLSDLTFEEFVSYDLQIKELNEEKAKMFFDKDLIAHMWKKVF
jgi:glycosyltransferase involved in cell wall biosynthesis